MNPPGDPRDDTLRKPDPVTGKPSSAIFLLHTCVSTNIIPKSKLTLIENYLGD